jgi:RHS repeat-associated protein
MVISYLKIYIIIKIKIKIIMKRIILSSILFMIIGFCYAQSPKGTMTVNTGPGGNSKWYIDQDSDGYGAREEEYAPITAVNQPAGYVGNSLDYDDTNYRITNIPPQTFYRDADLDTFGSATVTVYYSVKPAGYVTNSTDCNDADATINPNTVWYRDADADGYGISTTTTTSCTQPAGYVRNSSDYNDTTANITNIAPQTFYQDGDGDTFGNPGVTVSYSVKPSGYVTNNTDCNDADATLNPNTVWYRDADADGYGISTTTTTSCTQPTGYVRNASDYNDTTANITNIAPQTFYRDADNDTFGSPSVTVSYSVKPTGYVTNNTDCNDADATLNPNTIWYRDADGDGYGISTTTSVSCTQPTGYVRNASDYNDTTTNITNIAPSTFYRDADGDTLGSATVTVYYSAKPTGYVTNNTDYDDSTANITNIAPATFYRDADGDTFGSPTVTVYYSVKPTGYVTNNTDCNDADATLNPNTVWYRDADGDGYGISTTTLASCTQPAGYVRNSSDYNDTTVNITSIAPSTFYRDVDGDTFGSATVTVYYSVKPTGYVTNNSDYDDSTVNITNIAPATFYRDADNDTFGSPTVTVYYSVKPTGYVANNTDCNDADNTINPNTVWYRDADADGYGISTTTSVNCTQPVGYVRNSSDYNDTTANITNIAPSTFYQDTDGDGFGNAAVSIYYSVKPAGYAVNSTDCNDGDVTLNPNTKWYLDNDLDSLGDPLTFVQQCTKPAGNYVRDNTDNCPLIAGTSTDCTTIAAPSSDQNYIITKTYKKATSTVFTAPTPDQAKVDITYFDGLGRPMQSIANQQSNSGKDIVTFVEYDGLGRQVKDYLPFKSTTANMAYDPNSKAGITAYYGTPNPTQNGNPNLEATTNAFSEKQLESSPLNRVLQQAAPGNDWAMANNHTIKMDYQTNIGDVKLFKATATWDANLGLYDIAFVNGAGTTFYDVNQLYKTITYDENSTLPLTESAGSTVEFKNKEGQVVLKRFYDNSIAHDTYYVYDNFGNLTYVIPPKADAAITTAVLNDLCYQYKYDSRNRLVEKKLPGKQWEFIVYDKLDRQVATGPAASPFSDLTTVGWLITKYDAFSRPVYTGWMTSTAATTAGRKTLQDAQNSATLTVISESKQTTGTIDGIAAYYTNTVAPTAFKLLSVNYYDNYTFPSTPAIAIPASVESQTTLTTTQVKGLTTASWNRVSTTSTATLGETSATFYDAKARPVRQHTTNFLGGYTYVDSKLEAFSGQLQYTMTRHKRLSTDTELLTKDAFTYSAQDRLLTQTNQINGGTIEVIANNTYDELGQLVSKKVGNTMAAPVQKVDYIYNVRGWLTNVNDVNTLAILGDPKDLFAFKINYNGIADVTKKLYNGNISQTFWASDNTDKTIKNYIYSYDKLNRLKTATDNTTFFNEDNIVYDKNGNITKLKRNGQLVASPSIATPANYGLMDDLTYSYDGGNKLQIVSDLGNEIYGFKDDVTGAGVVDTSTDYSYDVNGNMLTDVNKGITNIIYNHLNLPTKIVLSTGNIVYLYNAAGQKVQKIVTTTSPASVITTDYLGGYQYNNAVLKFFPTAEGYVEPVAGSYKYVYQYKDHLGNIRLSYDKMLVIQEENNYYPFGLKHIGYNGVASSTNDALKYKYNGKELQDELGLAMYDYGARNYDPALGRFMNIDPAAEVSRRWSPYNYAYNNPLYFVDPDGRLSKSFIDELIKKSDNDASTKWTFNDNGTTTASNGESASTEGEGGDPPKKGKFDHSAFKYAGIAITGLAADDLSGIGIADDVLIPVVLGAASGKWLWDNRAAVASEVINMTDAIDRALDPSGFYYVTYTKRSKEGNVYVGRSSGYGNPASIVKARDAAHHMKDYGPATLSTFAAATIPGGYTTRALDPSYWAIRGSEQLQIESYRKAGISGNSINGISPKNDNLTKYIDWGKTLKF